MQFAEVRREKQKLDSEVGEKQRKSGRFTRSGEGRRDETSVKHSGNGDTVQVEIALDTMIQEK